jgi:hypothetical protein
VTKSGTARKVIAVPIDDLVNGRDEMDSSASLITDS